MSLFCLNPWVILRRQVIMLMTKLGAAFVLAFRIPNPPLLMFRCAMSVEYVGRSLVTGIFSSCLKKDRMMSSIPCVRYPFKLYH